MAGNLLRCPSCGQTRTHLVLTCAAPELVLTVGAGAPLNVGRDPGWATLTAQPLRALTRISRRHVTVLIDPDGTGWAEEYADGTVNGTHVGDTRLRPGVRTILRDGDRLRLGREIVSFRVRLYGPDPTGGANASRAAGEGYGPAATA
jgi:pSer/pThr/pTyr-binding forkhead associated (FHA) protein